MAQKLYRYIAFETLVDIVQRQTLVFVNPFTKWLDTYEGYLFRAINSKEGHAIFHKWLNQQRNNGKVTDEQKNVLERGSIDDEKYNEKDLFGMRCQSWSKAYDSYLMWNLYSNNKKAIMISSTRESLTNLENVELMDIEYKDNDLSLLAEISKVVDIRSGANYFPNILKIKRKIFEHEDEVRAYVLGNNLEDIYDVKITNIPEFITEVLVHPDADDAFVQTVKTFCENNGIKSVRKSEHLLFKIHE